MNALTPEMLADLRKKAEAARPYYDHAKGEYGVGSDISVRVHLHVMAANPATVLALLDRLEALEQLKRMAAKVGRECSPDVALQWIKDATKR